MSSHESAYPLPATFSTPAGPSTWQLFCAIAALQICSTLLLNRVVLNDDVYRSLLMDTTGSDELLRSARRWELLSYLATPVLLAVRIGFAALLVQLVLLGLGATPPLARIFRAGVWAQGALLLGSLIQTGWLASLPDGAIGSLALSEMPGSFSAVLPPLSGDASPLVQLIYQTSLFDLGWIALFILGLEERDHVPLGRATIAVLSAWGMIAFGKWALLFSLTSMT